MVDELHAICDAVESGIPLERVATVRTIRVRTMHPSPDEIRAIRGSLGLTQVRFAEFLGAGLTTVRSWNSSSGSPRPWHGGSSARSATIRRTGAGGSRGCPGRGTASGEARRVRREESRCRAIGIVPRDPSAVPGRPPTVRASYVFKTPHHPPRRCARPPPSRTTATPTRSSTPSATSSAWATGRRTRSRRFEGMSPLPRAARNRPAPTPRPRMPLPSRSPPSPHSTQSESRVTQASVLFPKKWKNF